MKEKKAAEHPLQRSASQLEPGHGMATATEIPPSHGDLIGKLPDDVLRTIISLLPTKAGARTQTIARRWRPLWRTAPLNLLADYSLCSDDSKRAAIVSKILSDHHGPARRFVLNSIRFDHKAKKRFAAQIESWFRSRALHGLQELTIQLAYTREPEKRRQLPPCILLCASSLVAATISFCVFPKDIAPSVSFGLLKHLRLFRVSISEDVFHGMLSTCRVLESLALTLESIAGVGCFRISSPTLRSVGLCACFLGKGELVIEDTPLLERLLLPCPNEGGDAIRVIRAPKLEKLGLLSSCLSEIIIANLVLKSLTPVSLKNTLSTVKILALQFSVPDLTAVIDVLRCFPCLETLYVIWQEYLEIPMKDVREYDPLDPVKCLDTHLKTLMLKNYEGDEQEVGFAKFFILNARSLKQIKFGVTNKVNKEWVSDQYRLLEVGNGASPDTQLEFIRSYEQTLDASDLSAADPFTCYFLNGVDALSEESH